jgi:uncharacterized protein (DUF488 family)
MYYRRKIVLAILELFGNQLEKLQLQKLLFILSQKQEEPSYHFVPYKFGCFSFQANADLGTLVKYGLVAESEKTWQNTSSKSFLPELKKEDYSLLFKLKMRFKESTSSELIRYTYINHPYFAIKSKIAEKHLDAQELAEVMSVKPSSQKRGLFTIGYEGISLEEYLNKLLKEDIKVLCDVRKNSKSMKYGFSKNQLKAACDGLGIMYIHIPEVGINSDKRQELHCQADYDVLFEEYNQTVIRDTDEQQDLLIELVHQHDRIAITCFEANICQCHRLHLANAVMKKPEADFDLFHI